MGGGTAVINLSIRADWYDIQPPMVTYGAWTHIYAFLDIAYNKDIHVMHEIRMQ